MVDKIAAERLQPSLLDRLSDDAPDNKREDRESRVIDISRLRDIVQRDLGWLLNTQNNPAIRDDERFPEAAASVLNYGLPEVSGEYATPSEAERIRRSITRAIELFEPRIREGTAEVTLGPRRLESSAVVAFDIRAEMWATPVPLEVYLRTEVDITTGEVDIERLN